MAFSVLKAADQKEFLMALDSRNYRGSVKRRLCAESLENRIVLASDLAIVTGGESLVSHVANHSHPAELSPTTEAIGLNGDFNSDGMTNAVDIDMLATAIRVKDGSAVYDLDNNESVDQNDMHMLIHTVIGTEYGDANLDMQVDDVDQSIWSANRFLTNLGWANGDFNGDSVVDVSDFNVWNTNRDAVEPTVVLTGDLVLESKMDADSSTTNSDATTVDTDQLPNDLSIQPVTTDGDFNGDSETDSADIDMLTAAIRNSSADLQFDLNLDGMVGMDDLDTLVEDILNTAYGDADLNGTIDGSDVLQVTAHIFTTGTTWATGDFNGDGTTDVQDFNRWNENRLTPPEALRLTVTGDSTDVDQVTESEISTDAPTAIANEPGVDNDGGSEAIRSGDLNDDALIDASDVDMLAEAIRVGRIDEMFDINEDSIVDHADMDAMIFDVIGTRYGDANLDLVIDSRDHDLWSASSYRTNTGWGSGDFNGDGSTDVSDFNIWNQNRNILPPTIIQTGLDDGHADESEEEVEEESTANKVEFVQASIMKRVSQATSALKRYLR